eukprot:1723999-Pleurochrysis_carterae.AAC.2
MLPRLRAPPSRLLPLFKDAAHQRAQVCHGGLGPLMARKLHLDWRLTELKVQREAVLFGEKGGRSGPVCRNHGQRHRHGLDVRATPAFAATGEHKRVGRAVQPRQRVWWQVVGQNAHTRLLPRAAQRMLSG